MGGVRVIASECLGRVDSWKDPLTPALSPCGGEGEIGGVRDPFTFAECSAMEGHG